MLFVHDAVARSASAPLEQGGSHLLENRLVSSDSGVAWQRKSFPPGRATLIAPAPSRPETIYVVTDRFEVYRSGDSGTTWERVG